MKQTLTAWLLQAFSFHSWATATSCDVPISFSRMEQRLQAKYNCKWKQRKLLGSRLWTLVQLVCWSTQIRMCCSQVGKKQKLLSAPNWFVQLRNDAMTSPALRVSEERLQQAVEGFSCSTWPLYVLHRTCAQEHQRKPPSQPSDLQSGLQVSAVWSKWDHVLLCVLCRWRVGGDGGGAEQREGDVRFLSSQGPELWTAQIHPHKLGKTNFNSKLFSWSFSFFWKPQISEDFSVDVKLRTFSQRVIQTINKWAHAVDGSSQTSGVKFGWFQHLPVTWQEAPQHVLFLTPVLHLQPADVFILA